MTEDPPAAEQDLVAQTSDEGARGGGAGDPIVDVAGITRRLLAQYGSSLSAREILATVLDTRDGYSFLGMTPDSDFERLVRLELDFQRDERARAAVPEPREPDLDEEGPP